MGIILLLVLTYALAQTTISNQMLPSCNQSDDICEFYLQLSPTVTFHLTTRGEDNIPVKYPLLSLGNGSFLLRSHLCNDTAHGLFPSTKGKFAGYDFNSVPVGDGRYKTVFLFNGSLPGPPLVVYEGQMVVVHVTNLLINEATTVHFHGIHQRGTPWMDGVGGVSQCPINPGETFTYRFKASPKGTHWYHTHFGTQRTMGAYGPFIVLPKTPIVQYDSDHYLMVSEWFIEDSADLYEMVKYESVSYAYGWDVPQERCFSSTKQSDGQDSGVFPFQSALLNGRGWFKDETIPLTTIQVKKGQRVRIRLISASMAFHFRVSVDGHPLHVAATDGHDTNEVVVESIIISGGERYDFWIDAVDPDGTGLYWIRAETLEQYEGNARLISAPRGVKAILKYQASRELPRSNRTHCTAIKSCRILNCPFAAYQAFENMLCVPITTLQSATNAPTIQPNPKNFVEHFLNFHFMEYAEGWKPAVNSFQHKAPAAPPQLFPSADAQTMYPCDQCQGSGLCRCTHIINVPLGATVQLNLMVTVRNPDGVTNGNSHNVHIHGQHFQVIKLGYASYFEDSQWFKGMTPDITCDDPQCISTSWTNRTWGGGGVEGIIIQGAPLKDTVLIPVGGYVVVRFVADNPGHWFMHCHTEYHNEDGMSLYFKVGEDDEIPKPPVNIPKCGNFRSAAVDRDSATSSRTLFTVAVAVLAVVCILLSLWVLHLHRNLRKYNKYEPIPAEDIFRSGSAL